MALSISQSHSTYRSGATPLPTFTGTGASGSITWSSPQGGTFTPATTSNGQPTTYTPLNRTQLVTVQATDGVTSPTTALGVTGTCPDRGSYTSAARRWNDRVNKSTAEDDFDSFVVKGPPYQSFSYSFLQRPRARLLEMNAFWKWHRKDTTFYLEDPQLDGVFILVRFDSEINEDSADADVVTYSISFIQDTAGVS